jgi:hypothetical protein
MWEDAVEGPRPLRHGHCNVEVEYGLADSLIYMARCLPTIDAASAKVDGLAEQSIRLCPNDR